MSYAQETRNLSRFSPTIHRGKKLFHPQTFALPQTDLFISIARLVEEAKSKSESTFETSDGGPIIAIVVADDLVVTFNRDLGAAGLIQSFIVGLFDRWEPLESNSLTPEPLTIDPEIELTIWTPRAAGFADAATRLWAEISREGRSDALDKLTTPSIYGNKLRMAQTLNAIAVSKLSRGSPVLDIMSGTGVVTRMLARRHPVTSNDANPYAALLTRSQSIAFADEGEKVASRLLNQLGKPWQKHQQALRERYAVALAEEERFLHGEIDEETFEKYVEFVQSAILRQNKNATSGAGDLITARYANAYFGVSQAIEIDSIRVAIESLPNRNVEYRDISLAALILAATICNPGPHFAQPRRLNSRAAFQNVIERRARSVGWEFEVALRRLASREPFGQPPGPTTCTDWREALNAFDHATRDSKIRTVYLDPPYSKLQYSRFYHVLNVLLANDYPPISGTGRYPPRSYRFSSRFEFQPTAAKKEFEEIIGRCADREMGVMISYGDRGFVPIDTLVDMTTKRYDSVDVFSEPLRHHSQGKPLSGSGGGRVTEFVIVAAP